MSGDLRETIPTPVKTNGCLRLIAHAWTAYLIREMEKYRGQKMYRKDHWYYQRMADLEWADVYGPLYKKAKEIDR